MGGSAGSRRSRLRPAGDARRVVVIGASMSGALAAVTCAANGRDVTVLERDVLPSEPQTRPGVPQAGQPHVLLQRGLLALERLLPGLRKELVEAGAVSFNTSQLAWLAECGWLPTGLAGYETLSLTRAVLDHAVLTRVRQTPGIDLRTGATVTGLVRHGDAWSVQLRDGSCVVADLVIDASGRNSRLPVWLDKLGYRPPAPTEVDARLGYATRTVLLPADAIGVPGVLISHTPADPAGGIAFPVEGGRWLVTGIGCGQHRPPRDAAGLDAYFASLRDPALSAVLGRGEPVGDVLIHRHTGNVRRHYERMRTWPDGIIPVGDALCAFNPSFGQGITVAACQAEVLHREFRRGWRSGSTRRVLRRCARELALPWEIAVGEDQRHGPAAQRSRRLAAQGWWARRVQQLAVAGDERAMTTLARVYNLMGSPLLLVHPALVVAAARAPSEDGGGVRPLALSALAKSASP